jgi:hypothetical protein
MICQYGHCTRVATLETRSPQEEILWHCSEHSHAMRSFLSWSGPVRTYRRKDINFSWASLKRCLRSIFKSMTSD